MVVAYDGGYVCWVCLLLVRGNFVQFAVTFRMRLLLRLRVRVPYATSMTLQILFQPGITLFVRGIIIITPRVRGESAGYRHTGLGR